MTEQGWRPLSRTPSSTITRILRSPAFLHARERASLTIESAEALRTLAEATERLELIDAPLSAVADRATAAVRFVRATADGLDIGVRIAPNAARERLLVAGLLYLVMPDDLVPDFLPGGYIDDALLLTWVFGAAAKELEPYLDEGDPPAS